MARKRKINNKFIRILLVVILVILAFVVYQKTSKQPIVNTNKTIGSEKQTSNDNLNNNSEKTSEKDKTSLSKTKSNNQKKKIPPIPVKETDNHIGELRIEGQVLSVDEKSRTIKIDQVMDDNSVKVNPEIKISEDAVIQNNNGKIKISDISAGAVVDIILSNNKTARSVTVIE